MLGYITGFDDGQANVLLADLAATLRAEGVVLAGVVQVNEEVGEGRPCHMDLHILGRTESVRISQDLGPHSQGCRLNAAGLERAVGMVAAQMEAGAALLLVNRFGKQEAEGRGFRPLIGQALAAGMPVVIAVADGHIKRFEAFESGMGTQLHPSRDSVLAFCRTAIGG